MSGDEFEALRRCGFLASSATISKLLDFGTSFRVTDFVSESARARFCISSGVSTASEGLPRGDNREEFLRLSACNRSTVEEEDSLFADVAVATGMLLLPSVVIIFKVEMFPEFLDVVLDPVGLALGASDNLKNCLSEDVDRSCKPDTVGDVGREAIVSVSVSPRSIVESAISAEGLRPIS